MNPPRTILAVLAGYLTLIVLGFLGGAILGAALHGSLGPSAIIGGETVTFVAAVIAGGVTARMAPERPVTHAAVLGLTVFSVTAVVTAVSRPIHTPFPHWYPYASAAIGGIGAFVGGAIATRSTTA